MATKVNGGATPTTNLEERWIKICDQLGDLAMRMNQLQVQQRALYDELWAISRRTKRTHFEGKRFDATVWKTHRAYVKYKDCFDVLAEQTKIDDAAKRKILKEYTNEQDYLSARAFIPQVGPKTRAG